MGELLLGGRYHLEELLGSGGMSVVWRAHDDVLGRAVAVKVLHLRDGAARDRIRAEARAAAALSHPNLAQVHDFGEDGFPFLVMELVAGRTLQQHLDEAPMPPVEVFGVCAGVAAGLAAAHAAGLVHQDVKPANIMVTATGAKLVDFGLATPAGSRQPEDVLGTPAYLAPERLSGPVEPPSDVYALGVLLYRMLSGTLPWTAETTTQLIRDHVFTPPAPLPPLPGVPGAVARLCMACLDKDPAGRPSAEAAAGVLATAVTTPDEPRAAAVAVAVAVEEPDPSHATGRTTDRATGRATGRGRRYALAALVLLVAAGFPWLLAAVDGADGRGADAATTGAAASAGTSGVPGPPAGAAATGMGPSGGLPATAGPGQATPGAATDAPGAQTWGGGAGGSTQAPTAAATTAGPPRTAGPPQTTGPAPAGPVTFTTEGGTVEAACAGTGQVRVVTSSPAKSYKTESQQNGPAATAYVEFRHGNDLVRMTFTCQSGTPAVTVTRGTR